MYNIERGVIHKLEDLFQFLLNMCRYDGCIFSSSMNHIPIKYMCPIRKSNEQHMCTLFEIGQGRR